MIPDDDLYFSEMQCSLYFAFLHRLDKLQDTSTGDYFVLCSKDHHVFLCHVLVPGRNEEIHLKMAV